MDINLTLAAIEYIKNKLIERGTPLSSLRLGIRGGKCSGFGYVIEFSDDEPTVRDIVFEFDGLKVIVDKKSLIYLHGSTLDYQKTIMQSGLKFVNPHEATRCGCGESFSIAQEDE